MKNHWYRWVLYISTTMWLLLAATHLIEVAKEADSFLMNIIFFLIMGFSGWMLGDIHKAINKDEKL